MPDDLKKYGGRLRQIEADVKSRSKVEISRVRFINTIINGILDVTQ